MFAQTVRTWSNSVVVGIVVGGWGRSLAFLALLASADRDLSQDSLDT